MCLYLTFGTYKREFSREGGKSLYAAVFGYFSDLDTVSIVCQPVRVFNVTGTSTAFTTAFQNVFNEFWMLSRAEPQASYSLFGWTTHIDIDDLRTVSNIELSSLGHKLWICTSDLY